MHTPLEPLDRDPSTDPIGEDAEVELLVSGNIVSDHANQLPVEVRRGMAIMTREGHEAGTVAAIVVDKQGRNVTHILLSRQNQLPEYRLVPLKLVVKVSGETVQLDIFNPVVSTLATWHGS